MARRKRVFPKKYASDFINTNRFDANKSSAYAAQRSKATIGSGPNTEPKLGNSFMQELPKTKALRPLDNGIPVPSGRAEAVDATHRLWRKEKTTLLQMYRSWQGDKFQGVSEYFGMYLTNSEELKEILFFSNNEFLLVMEFDGIRLISRSYTGRDALLLARSKNAVVWVIKEVVE